MTNTVKYYTCYSKRNHETIQVLSNDTYLQCIDSKYRILFVLASQPEDCFESHKQFLAIWQLSPLPMTRLQI